MNSIHSFYSQIHETMNIAVLPSPSDLSFHIVVDIQIHKHWGIPCLKWCKRGISIAVDFTSFLFFTTKREIEVGHTVKIGDSKLVHGAPNPMILSLHFLKKIYLFLEGYPYACHGTGWNWTWLFQFRPKSLAGPNAERTRVHRHRGRCRILTCSQPIRRNAPKSCSIYLFDESPKRRGTTSWGSDTNSWRWRSQATSSFSLIWSNSFQSMHTELSSII